MAILTLPGILISHGHEVTFGMFMSSCPLNHTKSSHIEILTLHGHSHLAWAFSPHVYLACVQGDFGDVYVELSTPPQKVTSCGNSHLASTLDPPCITILTLHGHSHLMSTLHVCKVILGMCMLSCPLHHKRSPHVAILTLHPPCIGILTSCSPCMGTR